MRSYPTCRPLAPVIVFCCALALWVGACGSPDGAETIETVFDPCQPLVVETDQALSQAQSQSIDDALAMWNAAGPLKLTRQAVADAPRIPVRFERSVGFMHGYYEDETGEVIVNRRLTRHEHSVVLAHELGHAFGLYHVSPSQRRSLMNPGNLDTELTDADVERVVQLWPSCAR